ncbi:hypothetical protein ACFL96_06640 [Thermoproteota archaeon]
MGDLDELKKLTPEERVKKLKEIEERSRKEIEEAQKLMTESMREIEEVGEKKIDIPIPQLTSVDVDALFGQEEKDMFKTKRFGEGKRKEGAKEETLEESVQKEKQKDLPPEVMQQYTQHLEKISDRLDQLKNMDQDHFEKYKQDYGDEISQMYDQVKEMQNYHSLNKEIESMHITDQIGELMQSYDRTGYKGGGV